VKNAVFCDVTPYGSCKNRRFGGTYRLHYQGHTASHPKRWDSSCLNLLHMKTIAVAQTKPIQVQDGLETDCRFATQAMKEIVKQSWSSYMQTYGRSGFGKGT
jgi:hypothetical protein